MKKRQQDKQIEYIEELVFDFQNGIESAGEELLKMYGGHPAQNQMSHYIGKYFKLLRFGKPEFQDKDTRLFLGMLIKDDEIRKQLRQSYQYKETKAAAIKKLTDISEQLRMVSDEDLEQELRMMFLVAVKRYKKTNRNFNAYIYNYYRYLVWHYINRTIWKKEPYSNQKNIKRFAEDVFEDETSEIDGRDIVFVETPMIYMEEDLGNSWVRGLTCGEEFKELTNLQRLILKLNYHDGYTDGKIAKMMGIHINTIFRQRKKADETVRQAVQKLIDEGYYQ